MKNILCFSDSNTYGEKPDGTGRFLRNERWTGLLQQKSGDDYYIIEEGLNGRTTVWDDRVEGDKCGIRHIIPCIESHNPLDLLLIMLGVNDLKKRYGVSPYEISLSVERLIKKATSFPTIYKTFKILLVAPTFIREKTAFDDMFGNRYEASLTFGMYFKDVALRNEVEFLDLREHGVEPSEKDGLHFDLDTQVKISNIFAERIKEILE